MHSCPITGIYCNVLYLNHLYLSTLRQVLVMSSRLLLFITPINPGPLYGVQGALNEASPASDTRICIKKNREYRTYIPFAIKIRSDKRELRRAPRPRPCRHGPNQPYELSYPRCLAIKNSRVVLFRPRRSSTRTPTP